jgi:hypothetical protein
MDSKASQEGGDDLMASIWEEFDYCIREGLKPKLVAFK